jgi:hypothetical protein
MLFQKLFPLCMSRSLISALSASRGWNNSQHLAGASFGGRAFSAPLLEIFLFTHRKKPHMCACRRRADRRLSEIFLLHGQILIYPRRQIIVRGEIQFADSRLEANTKNSDAGVWVRAKDGLLCAEAPDCVLGPTFFLSNKKRNNLLQFDTPFGLGILFFYV